MKYFVLRFRSAQHIEDFRSIVSAMALDWYPDEKDPFKRIVVTCNKAEEEALELMEAYTMFDLI